jgi:hypothetical protein
LLVDARPRRIEDVESLVKPERQEQEAQESDEDIIINEWRQVLTPTYPYPSTLFAIP